MSGYIRFLASYRTILAFGLVTALSSSFGQTFFISLFLPYFMVDFDLTKGEALAEMQGRSWNLAGD